MLPYCRADLALRLTRPGELLPWLGLALRGLVAGRLKAQTCRQPRPERETRWSNCTGCPLMAGCPHGETFEPDPPDAVRPVALAPHFPTPTRAEPGLEIPVRIVAVGPAVGHVAALTAALADAGRAPGLGPDRVTFELRRGAAEEGPLRPDDLPASPDACSGTVPRLGIGLTAPLFLRRRDEAGRRRAVAAPSLADLFGLAFRTVCELSGAYAAPPDADARALGAAAERVRLVDHCYEPFEQPHWSNRSREHYVLHGVVGGGVYADVPLALVPWLMWAGRLHAGTHRVAGAGGWRLVLD